MKQLFLTVVVAILAAVVASIFIHCLAFSAHLFYQHSWLLGGLFLFAAPVILWAENTVQKLHPEARQARWKLPSIFLGSCLSHLAGLSVGREGAAIELGKKLGQSFQSLKHGSVLGLTAAFSALFLHPSVGLLFALEYHFKYRLQKGDERNIRFLAAWAFSSVIGYVIGVLLATPHWHPAELTDETAGLLDASSTPFWSAAAFLLIGGVFITQIEPGLGKLGAKIPRLWRLWATGALTAAAAWALKTNQYNSLSTDLLQTSLWGQSGWTQWGAKTLFSLLALFGAWPGGFFVPLMVMGATCASALATSFALGPSELYALAALGCFLWVTPRFGCPLTCTLLTWQCFGERLAVWALVLNLAIYFLNRSFNKGFKKRAV